MNKYGWYNLLYNAADSKLQYFDEIRKMDVLTVFQFLMRQKEEIEFQNRLQKVYTQESKRKK